MQNISQILLQCLTHLGYLTTPFVTCDNLLINDSTKASPNDRLTFLIHGVYIYILLISSNKSGAINKGLLYCTFWPGDPKRVNFDNLIEGYCNDQLAQHKEHTVSKVLAE